MTKAIPLYIASANARKIAELSAMLKGKGFDVRGLADFPDYTPPPENGATFPENARIKARALREYLGGESPCIIADDSGLECDDLGGAPGVASSRFARESATDQDNNAKLVAQISAIPHPTRRARYVCALFFIRTDGTSVEITSTCEGSIVFTPCGTNGFGYDPYFYLPQFDKTMAELAPAEKNRVSHRGKALQKLLTML